MIFEEKLSLLVQMAKAISVQFGENCEVVIHKVNEEDVENENTIIHIENGHVTSRQVGGGPSYVVIDALKKDPSTLKDELNYLSRTHNGHILKSSTLYLKDDDGNLDAIFAINYDITNLIMADSALKSLTTVSNEGKNKEATYIPKDVNELLDELINESVKLIGKPVPLMNKNDKIRCIQFLNDKGAFLITRSGDKVSDYFNISKFTLYSYLDAK